MSSLPITTKHRITRIPQIPHVWEGDIFPIGEMLDNLEPELKDKGQCIVWVDGSEGFVRTMDVVRGDTGPEAMVRSLLKAIEKPQSPAQPARPHKVVVRDRELQFFLRGALQGLDIDVDYRGELPLLDELWRNLQAATPKTIGNIAPERLDILEERAIALIWEQAPWAVLAEYNLIEIQIDAYNVESLYACVMGMMGQEFGVIFYRSLESMKKFRLMAREIQDDTMEDADIERAFLQQDCWFVNFSLDEESEFDDDDEEAIWHQLLLSALENEVPIQVIFGSIHPYEGIRPLVDKEELDPLYLAMEAFGKFIKKNKSSLEKNPTQTLHNKYSVKLPWGNHKPHQVTVKTMPGVTEELEALEEDLREDLEDDEHGEIISNELFPDGCIVSFASLSENILDSLEDKPSVWVDREGIVFGGKKDSIPVIIIQTTRPKGKLIVQELIQQQGIEHLFFTSGEDPYFGEVFQLPMIKTHAGINHVIAEIEEEGSSFTNIVKKWSQKTKIWQGRCAVAIAMGSTGVNKGKPKQSHILGFFATDLVSKEKAGLEKLVVNLEMI
ncbi:hypothetical protein IQ215_12365 [Cyanobacterium stanieri LEGE 03274]|uniref:Uncharacterized protein n=1 Tax=Cyanobacterium stanieri LEGE 03274 TaxID=1828756 RepID=A0ABR9V8M7_9CHRO|nr:hypothetical protein [Cyanobacterium stanieri]MBE9223491.1 hypothetical protein [Cyanobacterium stanieri LEGE 03274]